MNSELPCKFQQVKSSLNVYFLVEQRLLERWPDAGTSCEMNNSFGAMLFEKLGQTRQVTNIRLDKLVVSAVPDLGQIPPLNLGRVEIVQFVQQKQLMPHSNK